MKRVLISVFLTLSLSLHVAHAQSAQPLQVLATTTLIADVARNIGGDHVQVDALMPPNTDVHAFEANAQDIQRIMDADLVLVNGAMLEETIRTVPEEYAAQPPIVVSNGVTILAYGIDRGGDAPGLQPRRLLVADEAGTIHVVNVFSDEVLATYTIAAQTRLFNVDDSFALALRPGAVNALDSGMRLVWHDDHYDPYLVAPEQLPFTVALDEPTNPVVNGEKIGVFDSSGRAVVLDRDDLFEDTPSPLLIDVTPGAGISLPLTYGVAVAHGGQIEAFDLQGNTQGIITECANPQAAASIGLTEAVIACGTQLIRLSYDLAMRGYVVGILATDANTTYDHLMFDVTTQRLLAWAAGNAGYLVYDVGREVLTSGMLALPALAAPVFHPLDAAQLVALTDDGLLRAVDIATGSSSSEIAVLRTQTSDLPSTLLVSGEMVYVSDPSTGRIIEVYAGTDGLEQVDEMAFDAAPISLAAFGAVVDPHALDRSAQVTGRILGDGVDCTVPDNAVHGPCDPHFWLDPQNVMIWADNIATAFAEADPDNADYYRANAAAYQEQLRALDAEIANIVSTVPAANRRLVTNHDFMGYFAKRYGFEIVGVVLPGGSTLSEPTARELAELIEIIEREQISSIIVEMSDNNRISEQVAEEVNITLLPLYSDSLSEPDGPAATYIDYMRYNATVIAEMLGG
jgi:ABC-type Zn uptake system ZnuABC Zn-binding protein ZnuA